MGLIVLTSASNVIRRLPPAPKRAIRAALDMLARDRFSPDLDSRRLDSGDLGWEVYRLRVGDWRVGYVQVGQESRVVHVFHRSEGYGWLERLG
ncbi:MAG: type II toxin-antitoxin system RelE/ParE family toxin [Candidatus Thermoplasmatota archaeon]